MSGHGKEGGREGLLEFVRPKRLPGDGVRAWQLATDMVHVRPERARGRGVLWVTLDRPERRNAITPEMHDELTPLFRRIAEDRAAKVVVLTGAGDKAFCVGADFGGMQDNLDTDAYETASRT